MSHRQSCNRCRQQKVRCLREEFASLTQPLSPCQRCAKAGVACVYSLRQRTRRSTEDRRGAHTEPITGGFGHGSEAFSRSGPLSPDFHNLTASFPNVDESHVPDLDVWDSNNLEIFSPIPSLPLAIPIMPDTPQDRDVRATGISDHEDPADVLTSQVTNLSQRTMRATRGLARPGCAPLTVSSPQVDEAFNGTNSLIRILKNIAITPDASNGRSELTEGLVFLTLASHQHLLALFRAICDSIHRCLESALLLGTEQQHRGLQGDGSPSVAQFVMVLQLLIHLINRIERGLFQSKVSSEISGPVTPITPSTHVSPPLFEVDGGIDVRGLPALAHALVRAIPDQHIHLRHTVQELQTRIECSSFH
ncbi:hypothetical protein BDW02DRAFT_564570 [Decorospora gaudefroyi]|uniref:Zn(2)-C6 fungal-type domain-containing protein n=1 Tax=Decorospora gaudefroyi TaxID=184978 RepID=A0A6A5KS32_9PLEO|nr:hypothetical protein BDW02DRAFT_564570 [Decorospora gaudefroyi]